MSYPTLTRGDSGEEVEFLQSYLNRVGAMLIEDGDYGGGTERAVKYAQALAGQAETGSTTDELWAWLEIQDMPFYPLVTEGVAFIALKETGGLAYYEQHTRFPHYPGASSGITIGVGYDLKFKSDSEFRNTWGEHLSEETINELTKDIGKDGSSERANELKQMGIEIPFSKAWLVFISDTLPTFYEKTKSIYPSLDDLPDLCRSVLVSLVFNRGTSLDGDRRKEMAEIQTILSKAEDFELTEEQRKEVLLQVASEILSMKRLWDPNSGLQARRDAEADLWREGIELLEDDEWA